MILYRCRFYTETNHTPLRRKEVNSKRKVMGAWLYTVHTYRLHFGVYVAMLLFNFNLLPPVNDLAFNLLH